MVGLHPTLYQVFTPLQSPNQERTLRVTAWLQVGKIRVTFFEFSRAETKEKTAVSIPENDCSTNGQAWKFARVVRSETDTVSEREEKRRFSRPYKARVGFWGQLHGGRSGSDRPGWFEAAPSVAAGCRPHLAGNEWFADPGWISREAQNRISTRENCCRGMRP